MKKAKNIFLHDTKGGNKENHSSLRLLLGRRKHAVKKSLLPSPSVFRDRQLPWQQRVTSTKPLEICSVNQPNSGKRGDGVLSP